MAGFLAGAALGGIAGGVIGTGFGLAIGSQPTRTGTNGRPTVFVSITVETKRATHALYGRGSPLAFVTETQHDGQALLLDANKHYVLVANVTADHPVYIGRTLRGRDKGLVEPVSGGRTIAIEPAQLPREPLFVACAHHEFMGFPLVVAREGAMDAMLTATGTRPQRQIHVRGEAELEERVDTAYLTLELLFEEQSASAARDRVRAATGAVLVALRRVAADLIETRGAAESLDELPRDEKNRTVRWRAQTTLQYCTTAIALVPQLLTAATDAGAKQYSVSYATSKLATHRAELLAAATADALNRAKLIAAACGERVEAVADLREDFASESSAYGARAVESAQYDAPTHKLRAQVSLVVTISHSEPTSVVTAQGKSRRAPLEESDEAASEEEQSQARYAASTLPALGRYTGGPGERALRRGLLPYYDPIARDWITPSDQIVLVGRVWSRTSLRRWVYELSARGLAPFWPHDVQWIAAADLRALDVDPALVGGASLAEWGYTLPLDVLLPVAAANLAIGGERPMPHQSRLLATIAAVVGSQMSPAASAMTWTHRLALVVATIALAYASAEEQVAEAKCGGRGSRADELAARLETLWARGQSANDVVKT